MFAFDQIHSFTSKSDAEKYNKSTHTRTNQRYSGFNQMYFTAGDKNQFDTYSKSSPIIGLKMIKTSENNIFAQHAQLDELQWPAYRNLCPEAKINTFNYIFDKYKKGLFNDHR